MQQFILETWSSSLSSYTVVDMIGSISTAKQAPVVGSTPCHKQLVITQLNCNLSTVAVNYRMLNMVQLGT